ncbi:MAG: AAA family ATPase [Ignavibacteria bacterium]|nr:AAA family ATPase [Ignavibacteria bacterium]
MYLEKFNIKNFRTIENLCLTFNKGLNILIGENNSGKTAIIDALRICIGYGILRRDLYVKDSDFHFQRNSVTDAANEIEFHLFFKIENQQEKGWFIDLLNAYEGGGEDLQMHFKFYTEERNGIKKIKYKVWGGANEGQLITPDVLSLLYHVHLDALRDAEQFLRPIRGNKLGQLYSNIQIDTNPINDKQKKKDLANRVHTAVNSDEEWQTHLQSGKDKINLHLNETSFTGKEQKIDVDFLAYDFNKLVENLKIQMPLYSEELLNGKPTLQKHFELGQNGLGYNNLVYTATVLGDLQQRKNLDKESYAALLIEEPEAHLHPQLQNLFFNYLNKLDKEQGFQLFITSHSPTITAKAELKSVIVLQNPSDKVHALSLQHSGLQPKNQTYLEKFLDVTKSQLFFANGVILVEGISEALLMKVFSRKVGETYDIEKVGIEVINIGGVGFEHFANLFNNEVAEKNLQTRCAIITDDDRLELDDDGSPRADKVKALERSNLKVYSGNVTFEYELFLTHEANRTLLLTIYKELHPRTEIAINDDATIYSKTFADKVKEQKCKSELALRLATHLENGFVLYKAFEKKAASAEPVSEEVFLANLSEPNRDDFNAYKNFTVPTYIRRAIKYAVKGEIDV